MRARGNDAAARASLTSTGVSAREGTHSETDREVLGGGRRLARLRTRLLEGVRVAYYCEGRWHQSGTPSALRRPGPAGISCRELSAQLCLV